MKLNCDRNRFVALAHFKAICKQQKYFFEDEVTVQCLEFSYFLAPCFSVFQWQQYIRIGSDYLVKMSTLHTLWHILNTMHISHLWQIRDVCVWILWDPLLCGHILLQDKSSSPSALLMHGFIRWDLTSRDSQQSHVGKSRTVANFGSDFLVDPGVNWDVVRSPLCWLREWRVYGRIKGKWGCRVC